MLRTVNCPIKKENLPKDRGREGEKRKAYGERLGNGGNLLSCDTEVYYFSGYTEGYPNPNRLILNDSEAGWYTRERYVEHVVRAVEALAILTGDVELFARNEAQVLGA